jgi:4a-hydroxytetrahydrobiopterin dehydratase
VTLLSEEAVSERLRRLPRWERAGAAIRRRLEFPGFPAAVAFVNRVAEVAEALDHHPDILIEYRRVTLTSWSHDQGGLTERDFRLAARLDALVEVP